MFGRQVTKRSNLRSLSAQLAIIGALAWVLLVAVGARCEVPDEGVNNEAWARIQDQIESERYRVTQSDRPEHQWRADNPRQRLTAHFGYKNVVLVSRGRGEPAWKLGLRLTAWGARNALEPVDPAGPMFERNRVEYRRGPLTEWYVNSAQGLEQGFTIGAPPDERIEELVIEMALYGLTAKLAEGGRAALFSHEVSGATLSYSGLVAWDAVGTALDARMALGGGGTRMHLVVSVGGAVWPITVDPVFTQVEKLLPTPALDTTDANFGRCVAVDGEHMIVGIQDLVNGEGSGAAHIFSRDQGGAGTWGQVAKLIAADGSPYDRFGQSVSISADIAIVGAPNDDDSGEDSGAAYLFQRDQGSGVWEQIAKLTPAEGMAHSGFGWSVSISADDAVVGAHDDTGGTGSVYVFQRDHGGLDTWGQVARITAPDGAALDWFGFPVSISGDTVVAGASGDNDNGEDSGSAYVFYRDQGGADSWGLVTKITPADGAENDRFGRSVSVSGSTTVIGAFGDNDNGYESGSAYVFYRNQGGPDAWGQITKITPADGAYKDHAGFSVSISDDTAIVGAHWDDDNGLDSGSAYVFQRDHNGPDMWGQVAKITPADGADDDRFGYSVAVDGDFAVVGAYLEDENGEDSGSTYIYYRDQGGTDTWGSVVKHPCPPVLAARGHGFGTSVAFSGDTAVVGAEWDDDSGLSSGAAYIFQRDHGGPNAWGKVCKLMAADGAVEDHFGVSVSISGDTTIVGAYYDDDYATDSGSAYIFQRDLGGPNAWGQLAKLTAVDGDENDQFGFSVSMSGDTAVVGAYGDDDYGEKSGSAYVFQRNQGGTNSWGLVRKIIATDGVEYAYFGWSVSVSDDTAIVGARDGLWKFGSAYIFQRDQGGANAWGQVTKIMPPAGTYSSSFGYSVSLRGDTAIVGAVGDDGYASSSGAVYVYQRDQGGLDSWGRVAKIAALDGASFDSFGCSISISGDTAVIGAYGDADNGRNTGSAYVFRRNYGANDAWGQFAKMTPADGAALDLFGISVAVSGDTAVVGARADDDLGTASGSAYIFTISVPLFADGFETGDTSEWSLTVP